MPLHRRLPKRGFKNAEFALKLNEVNLGQLQAAIDAGKLDADGDDRRRGAGQGRRAAPGQGRRAAPRRGRNQGQGDASRCSGASKSAVAAVEKAGGSVEILAPKRGDERAGGLPPI